MVCHRFLVSNSSDAQEMYGTAEAPFLRVMTPLIE
jgi:hypothetical protein